MTLRLTEQGLMVMQGNAPLTAAERHELINLGREAYLTMGGRAYSITPVPAPRQTRSDKWKERPCVMQYRAFRDEIRRLGVCVGSWDYITFILPMPDSWNQKKRNDMRDRPHQQKPDIDNLLKALLDAIHEDDSHIHSIGGRKLWGDKGMIIIRPEFLRGIA